MSNNRYLPFLIIRVNSFPTQQLRKDNGKDTKDKKKKKTPVSEKYSEFLYMLHLGMFLDKHSLIKVKNQPEFRLTFPLPSFLFSLSLIEKVVLIFCLNLQSSYLGEVAVQIVGMALGKRKLILSKLTFGLQLALVEKEYKANTGCLISFLNPHWK